jgi:hypothetical protein
MRKAIGKLPVIGHLYLPFALKSQPATGVEIAGQA